MALLLAFVLLAQSPESIGTFPKFEDFSVQTTFKGTPAPPILRTHEQRMYRTSIRYGAKGGPNFAGHYTIAKWGCGSACVSIAIIDATTGIVWDDPFQTLIFGTLLKYDLGLKDDHGNYIDDEEPLMYKLDSRLLIARGCPGQDFQKCAAYFYEWTGSKLRLLRKVPATSDSDSH